MQYYQILPKMAELVEARGMRASKAATKLGCGPVEAKAASVAYHLRFVEDAEGMVHAAATIGRSCMTEKPDGYARWARMANDEGVLCVAVATYKDSRCLVRTDARTFVQAYGVNAGDLIAGLKFLGYREDPEAFLGLTELKGEQVVKVTETLTKSVCWETYQIVSQHRRSWDYGKVSAELMLPTPDAGKGLYLLEVSRVPSYLKWAQHRTITHRKEVTVATVTRYIEPELPKLYCDSRRQFI